MQNEEYEPGTNDKKIKFDSSLLLVEDKDWFRVNTWGFVKSVSDEVKKAWVPIFRKFNSFYSDETKTTYIPMIQGKKEENQVLKGSTLGFLFEDTEPKELDREWDYFEIDIKYGIPFLRDTESHTLYYPKNYQTTLAIREHRYNGFIDQTIEKYEILQGVDDLDSDLEFMFNDIEFHITGPSSEKHSIIAEDENGEEYKFTVRTNNLGEGEFVLVSQEEGVSATNQSKATESPEAFASWDNSLW